VKHKREERRGEERRGEERRGEERDGKEREMCGEFTSIPIIEMNYQTVLLQ